MNDITSAKPMPPIDVMRELSADDLGAVNGGVHRSVPNGRTDVIKAMGNLKWADLPLSP
jgi:hypothetical protein